MFYSRHWTDFFLVISVTSSALWQRFASKINHISKLTGMRGHLYLVIHVPRLSQYFCDFPQTLVQYYFYTVLKRYHIKIKNISLILKWNIPVGCVPPAAGWPYLGEGSACPMSIVATQTPLWTDEKMCKHYLPETSDLESIYFYI